MNNANDINNIKLLEIDPWLEPFAEHIKFRIDKYTATKKTLLGNMRKFKSFANAHLYYGFHLSREGWYYREWAPEAEELNLIGEFNNWDTQSHPLKKMENGNWEIFIPGTKSLQHLSKVKVRVKAKGIARDRLPLYIHKAEQDPATHNFYGQIWRPSNAFLWTDKDFKVPSDKPLLIYEAHIGMAQEKESIGSYKEFTKSILPWIKKSGYNAVQLMAITEHPYYASFGYHISNFFAASSWFGTPEDLKELIDTAHSMGIVVLMDLVHSHAVKNISEGINEFDGTDYQFFHTDDRGNHPAWDSKLFNYSKPEVIHFLLSNIKYWMEEYHFDGFRFDGITSMIYHDHGLGENFDNYNKYFSINTDTDALCYLQFANELIKEIRKDAITLAEDMSGMPGMCLDIKDGGIGFDYRLSMGIPDFWIKTLTNLKDEDWKMSSLWHELVSRRPLEKNIGYVESHDQALVGDKTLMFRLADKEMYWHMSKMDRNIIIDRALALHKLIRFITLTLGGEGYLNFIGNEFGHPEWVDFPREGNNWSFKYARRQWNLVQNTDLCYEFLYNFDKNMLQFVDDFHVVGAKDTENLWIGEDDKVLAYKKSNLIFLFNFNPTRSFSEFSLPTLDAGSYKVVFSSDTSEFGGQDRISQEYVYNTKILTDRDNKIGVTIYSPSRTVLVLKKI
jgi:1,4-alpha-glucan branching enzyme